MGIDQIVREAVGSSKAERHRKEQARLDDRKRFAIERIVAAAKRLESKAEDKDLFEDEVYDLLKLCGDSRVSLVEAYANIVEYRGDFSSRLIHFTVSKGTSGLNEADNSDLVLWRGYVLDRPSFSSNKRIADKSGVFDSVIVSAKIESRGGYIVSICGEKGNGFGRCMSEDVDAGKKVLDVAMDAYKAYCYSRGMDDYNIPEFIKEITLKGEK